MAGARPQWGSQGCRVTGRLQRSSCKLEADSSVDRFAGDPFPVRCNLGYVFASRLCVTTWVIPRVKHLRATQVLPVQAWIMLCSRSRASQ